MQIFLVFSPRFFGSITICIIYVNSKLLEPDSSLANRVFGGIGLHPALIPTGFSSKFGSLGGHWRAVGTSLLLAIVERSLNYYLWGLVCRDCFPSSEEGASNISEVISHPAPQQGDSTLVVTSPPLASVKAKSKDRSKSNHRVSKRPKKKKGKPSPTSQTPSTSRGSRETSSMLEEAEPNVDPPSFAYQDQIYPGGPEGLTLGTQPPSFAPYPSPTYQTMQTMPPIQGAQTFGPYQAGQTFNNPDAYQMAYSPQPPQSQAGYSVGYSSRIEDVARGPSGQQENADPNQPQIRSQYIMARQDSVWRATH
jgi:hypothetical protein